MNEITIYGKVIRKWISADETGRERLTQIEVEYVTCDAKTGEVISDGTKDIGRSCFDRYLVYNVLRYNGRVNKGGGRMTDYVGTIAVSRGSRSALRAARLIYGKDVARVDHPANISCRARFR